MQIIVPAPPVQVGSPEGSIFSMATPLDASYATTQDTDEVIEFSRGTDYLPTIARLMECGSGAFIKTIVISIGAWDMDVDSDKNVSHSIGDITKIVGAIVTVRSDAGDYIGLATHSHYNFVLDDLNILYITPAYIYLRRASSGHFDSTGYNDTGISRGYVVIWTIL